MKPFTRQTLASRSTTLEGSSDRVLQPVDVERLSDGVANETRVNLLEIVVISGCDNDDGTAARGVEPLEYLMAAEIWQHQVEYQKRERPPLDHLQRFGSIRCFRGNVACLSRHGHDQFSNDRIIVDDKDL